MTALRNKTILIISPQSWGKMFVSKHHYAVELAKRGNIVYFLNPPNEGKGTHKVSVIHKEGVAQKEGGTLSRGKRITIEPSGIQEGLFLIHHRLYFPYNIKFHFIGLFHAFMRPHIRRILQQIGRPVDIIWSFDLGNLYPFGFFPDRALKIFHPVDEPLNQTAIDSAKGGQIIFSVTREILDKYRKFPAAGHFINHGLAASFLQPVDTGKPVGNPIRVGLSGNFLRADIDRAVLLQIMRSNPEIVFECWGSYAISQSNIAGNDDKDTLEFIAALKSMPNVMLHGAISPDALAGDIHRADAFLICYDIKKDQSGGTNYHKIMEYLSTGKVVISNNVTTYKDQPELIQMVKEREDNRQLPDLFKKVITELAFFNEADKQNYRIGFAKSNTYQRQIERIEDLLNAASLEKV